jgi:VIT1/CCC1 family predicted Fe2+/Mn2+ transporter
MSAKSCSFSKLLSFALMFFLLGVFGVVLGTVIACRADRRPRHQATGESLAGVLLIAGFALLGYSLEAIFGPPFFSAIKTVGW